MWKCFLFLIFVVAIVSCAGLSERSSLADEQPDGVEGVDYSNENLESQEKAAPFTEQQTSNSSLKAVVNVNASDQISLVRIIEDLRIVKCKWLKYESKLPSASIIIPFFNEPWSILLRTVHSVASRSPKGLVNEVILVDDCSTEAVLGHRLTKYVSDNFHNVRILRAKKRVGSIKAKLLGARVATGSVLVFLDSHCEVGINWLPPLLQPIKHNYRIVTCPFIDIIDNRDFSLRPKDNGARGAFDWNMKYRRLPRFHEDDDKPEQPFDNPIMAGDTFAISKRWFWELGGYDQGLELWGGEQYELSFKIWMCGGSMVDVPCSRIGHVFTPPVAVPDNFVIRNYKRIAEVWMDEWKKFLYHKQLEKYSAIECGNLTAQRRLRDNLRCKSFNWFMEKVAFDILYLYPPKKVTEFFNCRIIPTIDDNLCVDSKFQTAGGRVRLDQCISQNNITEGKEQLFHISMGMDIRPGIRDVCFDVLDNRTDLVLNTCKEGSPNQNWEFNFETGQFMNKGRQLCLHLTAERMELSVRRCSSNILQKWRLKNDNDESINRTGDTKPFNEDDLTDILIKKKRKYLSGDFLQDALAGGDTIVEDIESNNVLKDVSKDVSKDISKDVSKDVLKDVLKDVSKDVLKYVSKHVSKNVSKDVSKDVLKDVLKDVSKDVSKNVSKNVSKDVSKDVLKDVLKESYIGKRVNTPSPVTSERATQTMNKKIKVAQDLLI